ncbi:MAG: MFS transporter [Sphingobacteriales bacterium]|nr:MAG: MFS transporter [Sphingobacteriales bacterium]
MNSVKRPLSNTQILIMSATAGICVANVYYSQPILTSIAHSLNIDEHAAGLITVLSQAGYGLGLFFITPLGDKMDRKKLILYLQLLLIASLIGMALSPGVAILYVSSLAIGLFAVSAQVILAMAASLTIENSGKVIGIVFTGILVGVLSARVFSGFITEWLSWRYVFGISAFMVTLSAIFMQTDFPQSEERFAGSYSKLLGSAFEQFRSFPILRRTALLGALTFGTLSSFWTTLTFYLSAGPFHYQTDTIGLFGLLAVAGALLVPLFGKLTDQGGSARKSVVMALSPLMIGIICLKLFPLSLLSLCIAVILLDICVQATQVTNIALIYALDPKANSRINTVYMTCYFIGGATGTLVGLLCWQLGGWELVTWQMMGFSGLAFLIVMLSPKDDHTKNR